MSLGNTFIGGRRWGRRAARAWTSRSATLPPPPWRGRRPDKRSEAATTVEGIVAVPRLMACLEWNRQTGGRAPEPDGLRYPDFGRLEAFRAFEQHRRAVLDLDYRPPPSLTVKRPKEDGTFRELALDDLVHRALATSVRDELDPEYDRHMSPLTHSAGGRGVGTLLAELAAEFEFGRYDVLLNLDVKGAFPNLPIDPVLAAVQRCVADDHLAWLVETLLRGSEGENKTIGIPQGLAVSPQHLDLILSCAFDAHWPNTPDNPL